MEKIKEFFQTKTGQQIYSFIKTYITLFIGIVVFADSQGIDVFTLAFLVSSTKASLLSFLRTVYKLATE